MSTRRDDELDLLDNLSEGLAFFPEATSVSVDAEHMRRVIEIARRAVDAAAAMPDLTATAFVQVGETPRGYALFRAPNEAGGHTYWSDEIGGGVMVWDTCLVSAETLRLALSNEEPVRADLRKTLPGISPPVLRGDNLAIFFASTFEPGAESDELDDTGTWPQEALDKTNVLLDAIHAHYAPHISGVESGDDRPTEHRLVDRRQEPTDLVEELTRRQFELDWCDKRYGTPRTSLETRWEQTRAAYRHRVEQMISTIERDHVIVPRKPNEKLVAGEVVDALMESQYRAGLKAGWNMGISGDDERFQSAIRYEGHLKPIRKRSVKYFAAKGSKP